MLLLVDELLDSAWSSRRRFRPWCNRSLLRGVVGIRGKTLNAAVRAPTAACTMIQAKAKVVLSTAGHQKRALHSESEPAPRRYWRPRARGACSACYFGTLKHRDLRESSPHDCALRFAGSRGRLWLCGSRTRTALTIRRRHPSSSTPLQSAAAGQGATPQSQGSRGCRGDKETQTSVMSRPRRPPPSSTGTQESQHVAGDAIGPGLAQASLNNGTSGLPSANPSLQRSHSLTGLCGAVGRWFWRQANPSVAMREPPEIVLGFALEHDWAKGMRVWQGWAPPLRRADDARDGRLSRVSISISVRGPRRR